MPSLPPASSLQLCSTREPFLPCPGWAGASRRPPCAAPSGCAAVSGETVPCPCPCWTEGPEERARAVSLPLSPAPGVVSGTGAERVHLSSASGAACRAGGPVAGESLPRMGALPGWAVESAQRSGGWWRSTAFTLPAPNCGRLPEKGSPPEQRGCLAPRNGHIW